MVKFIRSNVQTKQGQHLIISIYCTFFPVLTLIGTFLRILCSKVFVVLTCQYLSPCHVYGHHFTYELYFVYSQKLSLSEGKWLFDGKVNLKYIQQPKLYSLSVKVALKPVFIAPISTSELRYWSCSTFHCPNVGLWPKRSKRLFLSGWYMRLR